MPYKKPEDKWAWRRRPSVRKRQEQSKAKYEMKLGIVRYPANRGPHLSPMNKRKRDRGKRARHRKEIIRILGGACERCGENDPAVLECDHRKPLLRRRTGNNPTAWNTLAQIRSLGDSARNVFALLCANCHRKKSRENDEFNSKKISALPEAAAPPCQLGLFDAKGTWKGKANG